MGLWPAVCSHFFQRSIGICSFCSLRFKEDLPMKRQNGLTLAAFVLLFSASALASSIDPGGIIRKGYDYADPGVAIVEPGLILTFDGEPRYFL